MAGCNPRRPGKRARHSPAAIGAATVLWCCLAWAIPAHAVYEIATSSGVSTTECYSIRGEKLVQCDGRALDLRAVQTIDDSRLTPAEIEQRAAAVMQFMQRVTAMLAVEEDLRVLETENHDVLEYIVALNATGKSAERLGDARSDVLRTLERINRESRRQIDVWRSVPIPDRELVPLRDIKILQYTARSRACREWMLYLKTADPTVLANAREHERQADIFAASFQRRFERIGSEEDKL